MILVALLYAIIASTFTLAKLAICTAHPLFLVGVRMSVAGAAFLAFWAVHARSQVESYTRSWRDLFDFVQVIIFHIYLAFMCEFIALARLSSIKVTVMYTMTPFITMVLSYFLYRHAVTRRQLAGALLAFVGLLPLMSMTPEVGCTSETGTVLWPELVLLIAITSSSYAWFVIKRLMMRGYSLIGINGISMFVGGLLSLATWYLMRVPGELAVRDWGMFLVTTGALMVLSNGVAYTLYGWLLTQYSINFVSCAGFLSPIFGAFLSTLVLHETLGWEVYGATITVALGLYLFYYDE